MKGRQAHYMFIQMPRPSLGGGTAPTANSLVRVVHHKVALLQLHLVARADQTSFPIAGATWVWQYSEGSAPIRRSVPPCGYGIPASHWLTSMHATQLYQADLLGAVGACGAYDPP
ncbi:hypothetical protein PSTG_04338 [Puccinia striiformis f. sp. tritici PST-78]|uniref:Uncharacterized protein n=1 Tax=Puccinia striiformis f. sp. tritici PST-78 TaxID=1165861 RepID=A0A0L0VT82_9BASI|nr:hypothetical protein PSTG_04338 [Puccinia striiformis f. sp. tritici PST-78]